MKNLYTLVAVLIGLVSVSCQKISVNTQKETKTLACASIADADDATKTSLDVATKKLTWAENDKIYVVAADTKELWKLNEFTIDNSSINEGSAEFTSDVDMSDGTFFVAFYGKKGANDGISVGDSGCYGTGYSPTYIMYTLPYEQPYCSTGPNIDYLFMRSTKDSGNSLDHLIFTNLSSVMKIRVKDSRTTKAVLSSIKIVCDNTAISGRAYSNSLTTTDPLSDFKKWQTNFSMFYNNTKSHPSITAGGTYGNAILLKNINTPLTDAAQDFYVVVFPGNHGKITITLTDSESNTKDVSMPSFTSSQGTIYNFPVIDFGEI